MWGAYLRGLVERCWSVLFRDSSETPQHERQRCLRAGCTAVGNKVAGLLAGFAVLVASGSAAWATDPAATDWSTAPIYTFGFADVAGIMTKLNSIMAPVLVTLFMGAIGLGVIVLIWRTVVGFSRSK